MRKPTWRFRAAAAIGADRPRAALARAGVRPRKSRGQNFLVQERIAERIVALARLAAGDVVIEVGPGLGVLSAIALRSPLARLILVELDERLAAGLQTRFAHDPRVTVLHQDFLQVDLARLVEGPGPVKVLGNLPFNVAAAILERLCARSQSIVRMVLMFQREVADRIRARPGDREYGALTVFAALYWEVSEYFRVAAGSFHPRPKVDAAVLVLEARAVRSFTDGAEAAVRGTIRAAFSAPRKTIRNSLAGGLALPSGATEEALLRAGIDPLTRPATLSVEDFVRLSRVLYPDNLQAARRAAKLRH
jgi:16S rRNA (adenine1518-N6/adenine1519-N6)-dimethyltransferase